MTSTDDLRRLLDERGVEYEAEDMQTNMQTYWGDWCFMEPLDAKPHTLGAQCELMLIPATPEQAIAATMGNDDNLLERENSKLEHKLSNMETKLLKAQERIDELNATLSSGTCEMHRYKNALGFIDEWKCSECNADVSGIADDTPPNYCPNCGRKIVSS